VVRRQIVGHEWVAVHIGYPPAVGELNPKAQQLIG
jgi:hypothetical protein